MPGASPASSGGTGMGGTAYIPKLQGTADTNFWSALQPMFDTGVSGAGAVGATGSPSANAYLQAMGKVDPYITGNPAADQGQIAAQNAYNYDVGTLFPQAQAGSSALFGAGMGGLPYGNQALQQGFSPLYGQAIASQQNNPFIQGYSMPGAIQGAQLGMQGANQLQGAGEGLLQSGFDPQSALFNRSQQQLMDQTNAINAMSGVAGTPYGASVASNAMGNFDINWQNQQLGRQAQAAGAASPLFQAAPGLAAASGGLPSGVYSNQIQQILSALGQANQGGQMGAGTFGSLLGSSGGAFGGANQLGQGGASAMAGFGAAPFQAGAQVGSTDLNALSGLAGLGNQAFQLPQQAINDLESYLGLGQSASQLSGNLGQMGMNQLASGIGGGLSGLNSLFGGNGLFGSGSGGFGGGGGAFGANGAFGSNGLFGGLFGAGGGGGGMASGMTAAELFPGASAADLPAFIAANPEMFLMAAAA